MNLTNSTRTVFRLFIFNSFSESFQTLNILEFFWQKVPDFGSWERDTRSAIVHSIYWRCVNWETYLRLYGCSFRGSNNSVMSARRNPLLTLYISVARFWRLLLWIEKSKIWSASFILHNKIKQFLPITPKSFVDEYVLNLTVSSILCFFTTSNTCFNDSVIFYLLLLFPVEIPKIKMKSNIYYSR